MFELFSRVHFLPERKKIRIIVLNAGLIAGNYNVVVYPALGPVKLALLLPSTLKQRALFE